MNSAASWSDRFEEHLRRRVIAYGGSAVLADMLQYHFGYGVHGPARRGKRLRPTMVARACEVAGGDPGDALDAAAAVELLHNYSLVHDDIEDSDRFRHGRPTLWSVYGVGQAINAGDAMCAISFLTLGHSSERLAAPRVLAMIGRLNAAHRIMCDGQSLDLQFESERAVDVHAYNRMIASKTAALFEASCALGALGGGGDDTLVASCAQLGHAYGMAFQIRDDYLGIWASQGQTGKSQGGDIARRKWTYPIVWALGGPPSAARTTIADAYAKGTVLGPETVDDVTAALEAVGAREAAMRAIAEPMAVVEQHPSQALREYLLDSLAEMVG
jgi:geranylgeranyl diphosphate synthase type I